MEVKLDRGVRKLYTESRGDFRALLVLGESNNLELWDRFAQLLP